MITDTRSANIIPFDYPVDISLAANGSTQKTLTLAADSVFELHEILIHHSVDAATDFAPDNCSIQLTDQSTGRQLSSGKVHQALYAGVARFARPLRRAVQFPPANIIQFDVADLSGQESTVQIILRGYKLFQLGK